MSIVAHKEVAAVSSPRGFQQTRCPSGRKLGTTAVLAAKKYMPKANLRLFDDEAQAYQELLNGKVHAVVGSAPRPAYEAVNYPDTLFLPLDGVFTKEPIGFAVRKGDSDTLAFLNTWITKVWSEGWLRGTATITGSERVIGPTRSNKPYRHCHTIQYRHFRCGEMPVLISILLP